MFSIFLLLANIRVDEKHERFSLILASYTARATSESILYNAFVLAERKMLESLGEEVKSSQVPVKPRLDQHFLKHFPSLFYLLCFASIAFFLLPIRRVWKKVSKWKILLYKWKLLNVFFVASSWESARVKFSIICAQYEVGCAGCRDDSVWLLCCVPNLLRRGGSERLEYLWWCRARTRTPQ